MRTLKIAPTDSNSAVTTTFMFTLCEMNLSGRNVRSRRRIYRKQDGGLAVLSIHPTLADLDDW